MLLLALFVVQPIHSAGQYRKYVAKIEAGELPDRPKLYRRTIVSLWVMLAVLAAVWLYLSRPAAALGITGPGGTGFWISVAVVLAGSVYLVITWRRSRRLDAKARAENRAELGDLAYFLPQDDRELRMFFGLSATAGIVEEFIYRGFLIWCLALLMPLWLTVIASSVAFGLAHTYQGVSGVMRTAVAGLGLGILYVASGSIWVPVAAHILADALQGLSIRELFRDGSSEYLAVEQPDA